ncbi:zinc ribbon domain-containing protein [Paraflavitalea sp. CAU 1676]|uniref:zinc ribbon domain-containing protein n=1 Tax=Paraflavitalea sp. CAU 1676 TaxID=3032598 RepID=UPI0023DC9254|nr:zinc ribbon domain-containing protein [Paraflavitalea sp. CAU 1676]MDF2191298.1 zinc ribbon domain-containing protein [Paraflavitalea sp. CAU 1676]
MESMKFCQSCSMPIDDVALRGTEFDGAPSEEYCKYCYAHGMFIQPSMTLDEMKELVVKKMNEQKVPEDIIEAAVERLPDLKRWQRAIQ